MHFHPRLTTHITLSSQPFTPLLSMHSFIISLSLSICTCSRTPHFKTLLAMLACHAPKFPSSSNRPLNGAQPRSSPSQHQLDAIVTRFSLFFGPLKRESCRLVIALSFCRRCDRCQGLQPYPTQPHRTSLGLDWTQTTHSLIHSHSFSPTYPPAYQNTTTHRQLALATGTGTGTVKSFINIQSITLYSILLSQHITLSCLVLSCPLCPS